MPKARKKFEIHFNYKKLTGRIFVDPGVCHKTWKNYSSEIFVAFGFQCVYSRFEVFYGEKYVEILENFSLPSREFQTLAKQFLSETSFDCLHVMLPHEKINLKTS